jgi:hypothetical protein
MQFMRIWLPIVLLSMLVTALAVSGRERAGEVPLVTIAEIHEDPWAWHGRRVRVVGSFNECLRGNCRVCDDFEAHLGRAENRRVRYLLDRYRMDSCASTSFNLGYDAQEIVRFNTVLLEAVYDATCSEAPDPAPALGPCWSGDSALTDTAIIDIVEARPAREIGLRWAPIMAAEEPDRAYLLQAFSGEVAVYPREFEYLQLNGLFVYVIPDADPRETYLGYEGGVCWCRFEDMCEGQWPTTHQQTLMARGNPYTCNPAARREDGTWYFPIQ